MEFMSDALRVAIEEFSKLPGIGRKTAQRLVFYLLKRKPEENDALAEAIAALGRRVQHCSVCFNLTESDPCAICASPNRNHKVICVVEEPNDVVAIEKTQEFRGVYHVLGGALSPLEGIGPEDLKIRELLERLKGEVEEVILATNANAEGEATAIYLSKLIKPLNVRVTRIAHGVPVGGDLEFTDEVTLARALSSRVEMK